MRLRILLLLTGLVLLLLVAWRAMEDDGIPFQGPSGPSASSDGNPVVEAPPELALDSTTDDRAELRSEPDRVAVGQIDSGIVVIQADEVDQCIDVRGTFLVLENESSGETYRGIIGDEGGALFENVHLQASGGFFLLRTEVPDREVFPPRFPLRTADFSGEPPSAAVSVALIHVHAISGQVRDSKTRAPIEGADVLLDSFVFERSLCDEEGRYQLDLPEPRGTIIVTAPGYQELLWHFPEVSDDRTWLPDQKDFFLDRDFLSSTLKLVVRNSDGSPAQGARVDARWLASLPMTWNGLVKRDGETLTRVMKGLETSMEEGEAIEGSRDGPWFFCDDAGVTQLRLLQGGRLLLRAFSDTEFCEATLEVRAEERGEATLQLAPKTTLRLRFVRGDRPVAMVKASLLLSGSEAPYNTTSNEAGEAFFSNLPGRGSGALFAFPNSRDGFVRAREVSFQESEKSISLEVQVEGLDEVYSGQVLDEVTRQPVEGALLEWSHRPAVTLSTRESTDGQGRFALPVSPSGGQVYCSASGYRDHRLVVTNIEDLPSSIALSPLVEGDTGVVVRVEESSGAVADAEVSFWARIRDERGNLSSPFEESVRVDQATPEARFSRSIRTGEVLLIDIQVRGEQGHVHEECSVSAGSLENRRLVLKSYVALSGVVVLGSGVPPVGHVRITWGKSHKTDERGVATTTSDERGHFVFSEHGQNWLGGPITSGPSLICARMPYVGALMRLDVPERGMSDLEVTLRPLVEVPIRVVDFEDGAPVFGGVTFRTEATLFGIQESSDSGAFLALPEGSSLRVFIDAPGYRGQWFEIHSALGASGVTLRLDRQ